MLYSIVPSMVLCLLCCYSYSFSHTHFIHSIRIPSVYSFHVFMSIPSGILRTSIHATLQSCMYAQRKKRVPLGTLKERKSQSHQHHHNPSQHKQHHSSTSPYQELHVFQSSCLWYDPAQHRHLFKSWVEIWIHKAALIHERWSGWVVDSIYRVHPNLEPPCSEMHLELQSSVVAVLLHLDLQSSVVVAASRALLRWWCWDALRCSVVVAASRAVLFVTCLWLSGGVDVVTFFLCTTLVRELYFFL